MRMIPVEEAKSIDVNNPESDICPFSMGIESLQPRVCQTSKCMAWYWTATGDATGVCALIYKPETLKI